MVWSASAVTDRRHRCPQACFVSDETFAYFSKRASALPIVVMGANATREQKMAGVNAGAVDFLEKPLSSLKLRNVWQHTVRKVRLRARPLPAASAAAQARALPDRRLSAPGRVGWGSVG